MKKMFSPKRCIQKRKNILFPAKIHFFHSETIKQLTGTRKVFPLRSIFFIQRPIKQLTPTKKVALGNGSPRSVNKVLLCHRFEFFFDSRFVMPLTRRKQNLRPKTVLFASRSYFFEDSIFFTRKNHHAAYIALK